jgi:translation initiation factor 5A
MGKEVQIMDLESYETLELPFPDDLKNEISEGTEVEYIEALGNLKIMRTK